MTPEQKELQSSIETFRDKVRALAKEHGIDTGIVTATARQSWDPKNHTLLQFYIIGGKDQLDLEDKARLGQIIAQSETCQQALKLYRALSSAVKRTKKKK